MYKMFEGKKQSKGGLIKTYDDAKEWSVRWKDIYLSEESEAGGTLVHTLTSDPILVPYSVTQVTEWLNSDIASLEKSAAQV